MYKIQKTSAVAERIKKDHRNRPSQVDKEQNLVFDKVTS